MANELTVTAGLAYSNAGVTLAKNSTDTVTVAANYVLHQIHTVTVAGEALPLGSVATPGFCYIRNTDGANFILVGNSGDTPVIRVEAGELAVFRFNQAIVPAAIADTGNVVIEIIIISD